MMQGDGEAVAQNAENDITACFDGTWQKPGHTSLNGVISTTSFDTGQVLVIEIMSKFCFVCHTTLTSLHECTKGYEGTSVDWRALVCLTLLIAVFIPEYLLHKVSG
jgi:hypothetical protein